MEHEELRILLKQLRAEALRIALFLETAYAKQSSCARLSYRAAQTLIDSGARWIAKRFWTIASGMRTKRYSLKGRRRTTLTMILG
jgi:hypothetical protein